MMWSDVSRTGLGADLRHKMSVRHLSCANGQRENRPARSFRQLFARCPAEVRIAVGLCVQSAIDALPGAMARIPAPTPTRLIRTKSEREFDQNGQFTWALADHTS